MDTIIQFIESIQDFVNGGFFSFLHDLFVQITTYYTIWVIQAKLYFVTVAWDVTQSLLANFQVSQLVNTAWASVDDRIVSHANFFRFPEAVTIIGQSYVTSFVIRLIG